MSLPPDRQNEATESVMRVLYQAGVALSSGGIVANLDAHAADSYDASTVAEALEGLESEGFVRRLDREEPYYELTSGGADYAEANLDSDAPGFVD